VGRSQRRLPVVHVAPTRCMVFWQCADVLEFRAGGATDTPGGARPEVRPLAFSPDGTKLAAECGGEGGGLIVWRLGDGAELSRIRASRHSTFDPSGRWMVTAGRDSLLLWDVEQGKVVAFLYGLSGPARLSPVPGPDADRRRDHRSRRDHPDPRPAGSTPRPCPPVAEPAAATTTVPHQDRSQFPSPVVPGPRLGGAVACPRFSESGPARSFGRVKERVKEIPIPIRAGASVESQPGDRRRVSGFARSGRGP
jgi:hypothetical protein